MGVAKLKKLELYYHKSVKNEVTEVLQRSGACQIIESAEDFSIGAKPEGIDKDLRACEEQQVHIRYLFRALKAHYVDPVSSLSRALGDKPSFSLAELARKARETDLEKLASSVKNAESNLNELRIEVSQSTANASILSKIKDLPYSLDILGAGTRTLKGALGTLPVARTGALTDSLKAYAADTDLFVVAAEPKAKETWAVVIYSRASEHEILEICVQAGMTLVDLPAHIAGTASEESDKIAARLTECREREAEILESLSGTANEWMPTIQELSDYWGITRDRYMALASSDATSSTVRTTFWVPADTLPDLQKQVESVAQGVEFAASDPTEDDNPPSLLRNNTFSSPAEALTLMFSPPSYGQRDPTPVMAPFFFLYFGMCLGDKGYALVILGVLWMLFKKYRNIPAGTKTFMRMFFYGAVATFFYGLFTGGFFGDFIDAFPLLAFLRPVKNAFTLIDPLQDPVTILVIALFLGVVQLMLGLGVAAYDEFRAGNIASAFADKAAWILFVMGLVVYGGERTGIVPSYIASAGLWTATIGALLIFWYAGRETNNIFRKIGSGLYALYSSTGYLGDILSYSRLMALGLAGGVLGSVINMLASMVVGIPVIGWLLAVVIILGGHIFSLAINLLGAFIHAMRLQYVEFFGKFYSGGGTNFKPLKLQTQYVLVCDEN
jgi:V/A-type H+-transporting ATPase subunit I